MQHAQNSGWVRKPDGTMVQPRNAAEVAALYWQAEGVPIEVALAKPIAGKAHAVPVRANHGRWIVDCPDCRSAQLACPADHRFMCSECANGAIDGKWRPVIWPKDAADLAELLDERLEVELRSWEPHETAEDLRQQNVLLSGETLVVEATKASEFEKHTHQWSKKPNAEGKHTCRGCPEVTPEVDFLLLAKQGLI